jgi:hypothetical protein
MFKANDETLASIHGGGFFTPVKFIAKEGGDILKMTIKSGPEGRTVSSVVRGVEVIDRPKQIARIAGTTLVGGGAVGTGLYLGLKPGQSGEAQAPSIEQLTGLE